MNNFYCCRFPGFSDNAPCRYLLVTDRAVFWPMSLSERHFFSVSTALAWTFFQRARMSFQSIRGAFGA